MATNQRRAAARRRAWGRGPILLRFEPLEGRQLLSTTTVATPLPDLHPAAFDTVHNLSWGDTFHARGQVTNMGTAAVTTPFQVAIYASPTPDEGANSVLLGQATIPAGLQPGQNASFDQTVTLPATPLTGLTATSGSVYVGYKIDPANTVSEASNATTVVAGQGLDLSTATIVTKQPADLVSTFLSASAASSLAGTGAASTTTSTSTSSPIQWGQPLQINATIKNAGTGNAPATRALVVLTPFGTAPGIGSDMTVGSIAIPSMEANASVSINQSIALPTSPPLALSGATQFTLSLIQDADYQTNNIFPHAAMQGAGKDSTVITIPTAADLSVANAAKADITPSALTVPTTPLTFGQSFQVSTTLTNNGQAAAGAFRVRFLLVGPDGSLNNSIFLGDTQLAGLKAGYAQKIIQSLQLPSQLPTGLVLNAGSTGKIAVLVDPEHALNLASRTDSSALSAAVKLRVVGTDGQVTQGVATTTPTTTPLTPAQQKRKALAAAKAKHSLEHNLKVFPQHVVDFVKNGFKNKK